MQVDARQQESGVSPLDELEKSGSDVDIADVEFDNLAPISPSADEAAENSKKNIDMIYEIPVRVNAELGHTNITIKNLLTLGPGSVVELERLAGESIDLLVNGVLIGKGDVVVVNENFGLRITEIVCVEERIKRITD